MWCYFKICPDMEEGFFKDMWGPLSQVHFNNCLVVYLTPQPQAILLTLLLFLLLSISSFSRGEIYSCYCLMQSSLTISFAVLAPGLTMSSGSQLQGSSSWCCLENSSSSMTWELGSANSQVSPQTY